MFYPDLNRGIINIGNLFRFNKVIKRLEAGEQIKIVFLGGSITQGCNATCQELSYVYRVYDWFKRKFPAAEIIYYNSGVGGTSSQFGAFRVKDDVLDLEPDMVFVEFSVNDANTDKFKESYESLLRRILEYKSEPAVFTFNNVQYDDGINAQEVHNEIAKYYELPIVSMKDSIYQEILLGKFSSEDITTDNLHPNDIGHGLLSEVICNLLEIILDKCSKNDSIASSYMLPEKPLTGLKYYISKRYRNEISSDPGFECQGVEIDTREQYEVKDSFKKGFIFNQNNSFIKVKLNFKSLCVQYLRTIGKNSPVANLYVDGKKLAVLDGNFDEYWDCLYLHDICEFDDTDIHEILIKVEDYPENCEQPFYLVSFITY